MCVRQTFINGLRPLSHFHFSPPPDEVGVDRRLAPEPACRQPAARAKSQKNSGIRRRSTYGRISAFRLPQVDRGQLRGISPGFQVPAGKGGERLVPEPGNPGVMIREITDAVVFEYSLVARPAYVSTEVDARADDPAEPRRRRLWL